MAWTMIWMLVILKIPVIAALWIIWWAVRAEPIPEEERNDGRGGGSDRHRHRGPRHPRPPRRGPHAAPPPLPPKRVRAAGRPLTRSHR